MKLNIFCNVTQRRAEATSTGTTLTWPDFTAGDRVKIATRFLEQIEGARIERTLGLKSGRLTLGVIDAQPQAGRFSLKVGALASSNANTTPLLAHNISEVALAASINALAAVTGSALSPCSVTLKGGTYQITFANGTTPGLTVVQNTLVPTSFARIRTREENGAGLYEMRLMQAPLAQAPIFTREHPPEPFITTVQDGTKDEAETYLIPEIQRLTIPPLFRGTFVLRHGDFAKSPILAPDVDEDGLAEATKALFAALGYVPTVRPEGDGSFLIVFDDDEAVGLNIAPMTVQVFTAPEGDVTFDLDLNTREVFDALREVSPRKDCYLEFEAEVCDDGEDPEDPETIGRTVTLFQAPVTLRRELNWSGLTSAASVDWLRPPANRGYVPFTTSQVQTGQQQAFSDVIDGNGVQTEFTFDHNLNSELCQIVVRENVNGGRLLRPDEYVVTLDSANALTVTFDVAPEANELAIFVVAIGPASVFQAHTHTIGQIVGLGAILDELGSRVETLEDLVAVPGAGASAPSWTSHIALPAWAEVFPTMATKQGKPALPPLPRAVRDVSITLIDANSLPEAPTAPEQVYVWDATSEVYVPGGAIRRGRTVKRWEADGIYSDGYFWWLGTPPPDFGSGVETNHVWYPQEMERVLWEMPLTAEQLAPGRTLRINWSFLAGLVAERPELRGRCTLRVRWGLGSTEAIGGWPSPDIAIVAWNNTPLLTQAIVLSRAGVVHGFSLELARLANGNMTASKTVYGKTTASTPPNAFPAGGLFLRADLVQWDFTDFTEPTGLPVGQVYLVNGKAEDEVAKSIAKKFPIETTETPALALSATIS